MAEDKQTERAERSAPTPQDPPEPHHIADEPVADADALGATVRSPTTETGLPVEEQVQQGMGPEKGRRPADPAVRRGRNAGRR